MIKKYADTLMEKVNAGDLNASVAFHRLCGYINAEYIKDTIRKDAFKDDQV